MTVKIRMVKKELYYIELSDTGKIMPPILVPLQENEYPIVSHSGLIGMSKAEIIRKGFAWFNTAVDDPSNPMHSVIVHVTDRYRKETEEIRKSIPLTDEELDEELDKILFEQPKPQKIKEPKP